MNNKTLIGATEICSLPDLGINDLNVRVDTGAAFSSLHVDNIVKFKKNGEAWVSFDIHPDAHNVSLTVHCESKLASIKQIKSSTANKERRYVISTLLSLGNTKFNILLTLTNRSTMTYLMLLGREAMVGRFIVDPEQTELLGSPINNSAYTAQP